MTVVCIETEGPMAHRRTLLAALSALPFAPWAHAQGVPAAPAAAGRPANPLVAKGASAGIHPWMEVGDAVAADVLVDGKVVARLDHRSTLPGLKKLRQWCSPCMQA